MAGIPGTASAIFGTVKDVGANVIMISQVFLCYLLLPDFFVFKKFHLNYLFTCRLAVNILFVLLCQKVKSKQFLQPYILGSNKL